MKPEQTMGKGDIVVSSSRNEETGMYVGYVINVPSIICQGATIDQLSLRLKAAYDKYVSYLAQKERIVAKQF